MNLDRFRFKAISKHDGEWRFATLNFIGDSCSVRWQHEWEKSSYTHSGWIMPETLCICTGLQDSNGKLIYENDYIKITGKEGNIEKALVRYDESVMEYVLIFNKSELPFRFVLMWLEEGKKCYVIGNKFDKEVEKNET